MAKGGKRKFLIQPYETLVFVGKGLREANAILKSLGEDEIAAEEADGVTGMTIPHYTKAGELVIVLLVPSSYDEHTIWHEAVHATMLALDDAGVEISIENDETFAYTQEHIVRNIRAVAYSRRRC